MNNREKLFLLIEGKYIDLVDCESSETMEKNIDRIRQSIYELDEEMVKSIINNELPSFMVFFLGWQTSMITSTKEQNKNV